MLACDVMGRNVITVTPDIQAERSLATARGALVVTAGAGAPRPDVYKFGAVLILTGIRMMVGSTKAGPRSGRM